jgi:RNA 3'-terminal phosphate cyclase (ATP)
LTCVRAAQQICQAKVSGACINSAELTFEPGEVRPGDYKFDIGSGGSCTLVLQALLPALLTAAKPSTITVSGGTHVPGGPPFEFFELTLLPWLRKLGPGLDAHMPRPGFMQMGGGEVRLAITPGAALRPLPAAGPSRLLETGAHIILNDLDAGIARREEKILQQFNPGPLLLKPEFCCFAEQYAQRGQPLGPGNVVMLMVRHEDHVTICATVGERNLKAEKVARRTVNRAVDFIKANVPVCLHLADQLLTPMALAGGGSFLTERVSRHTTTCLDLIAQFMPVKADIRRQSQRGYLLTLERI